jgi:predicted aldo/keto reductase-like oxidoreductase
LWSKAPPPGGHTRICEQPIANSQLRTAIGDSDWRQRLATAIDHNVQKHIQLFPETPAVFRLGLATRGTSRLSEVDVHRALQHGVNYWNWCGQADGMSRAVAGLEPRQRAQVMLAAQLGAEHWQRDEMWRELEAALRSLQTDRLDVATLYYVESQAEWDAILAPRGALAALREAQAQGLIRAIGVTSHQRSLAAAIAASGELDLLMIRYNAAHRGAETDIFPLTRRRKLPVVAFTCLRWGALPTATALDPPGFQPPAPRECYRYVLSHPDVAVALMAPHNGSELQHNLTLLADWRATDDGQRRTLEAHGRRVQRAAPPFP